MGLFDRLRKLRHKRKAQQSSATSSADTAISTSSPPSSSSYSLQQEKEAAKQAAALKAFQEEQAKLAEQERLAAQAEAQAQAEREAAAQARQQAAMLEQKMDDAKAISNSVSLTSDTTAKKDVTDETTSDGVELMNTELLSPTPTTLAAPIMAGDSVTSIAKTGLATLGTNVLSAVSAPVKTEADLQRERDAAAKARLSASLPKTTTTTKVLDTAKVIAPTTKIEPMSLSAPTASPMMMSTMSLAPSKTVSNILVTNTSKVGLPSTDIDGKTGLAAGTSRLLPSVFEGDAAYVTKTPSEYSTVLEPETTTNKESSPTLLSSPTPMLMSAPTMATVSEPVAPTTLATPSLLSSTPTPEAVISKTLLTTAPLKTDTTVTNKTDTTVTNKTDTTVTTQENLLSDTPSTEKVVSDALSTPTEKTPVSYEPASTISSGKTLLTGGGVNTDPYAAVGSTKIEQGIAGSGGTMDSYNKIFDKYYSDYFVDESLSPAEADAFLAAAPTTTLKAVRTDTRSYAPSTKVSSLLENGGQHMNAKGAMVYVPESEGFIIPPEILAKLAEQRGLRQAKGLPVREEGKFWKLDENGNVVSKVFAKPIGYRGSTGVNAGPAGGAGKHGFFKGTRAQKRAIRRQYKRRGGKLITSSHGTGFAVDFYDDADNTWDVYGYDLPTLKSAGSMVPKFYESTNKTQAQKVYDTWVKAYNVKYANATPAAKATAKRQAKRQVGQAVGKANARQRQVVKQKAAKRLAFSKLTPVQKISKNKSQRTSSMTRAPSQIMGMGAKSLKTLGGNNYGMAKQTRS